MSVKDRSSLGVLAKVGQGGQGVVYHAPGVRTKFSASLVYKEYKPNQRDHIDFEVLTKMPALVENSLSYADGERLISMAAWPCEMVQNNGEPTGFVMPEIPEKFFTSLTTMKGTSRNRAEFQHLLNHESVLNARGIVLDDMQRYRLLREFASALSFLHSHNVCVGDISPNNLLFSLKLKEAIYFIDCDSMSINGVSALTQVETPGWEVPAGEALATIYSDSYKLGLLALRLLAGDQHTRNVNDLPDHTPSMIRRIINDALRIEPQKRPLPEVWTYQLGYAIEEAQDHKTNQPPNPAPQPASAATISRPPGATVSTPQPPASEGPSNKAYALGTAAAVATIVLAVILFAAVLSSKSDSDSSATSSSSSPKTSEYASNTISPSSSNGTPRSSTPSLTWGIPPSALQGPDGHGDTSCAGGAPLGRGIFAAPATPTGTSYASCGFAKATGSAYLNSNPDFVSELSINVDSPSASCLQVQGAHPYVKCTGDAFVMDCIREGPDQAMWVACRGGNDAVVYIW